MTSSGSGSVGVDPDTGRPRNPLLAVLGAGDAAVAAVARAFSDAFALAGDNRREVQQRVAELPVELDALRGRFSAEELRRALDAYRAQVERTYTAFAGRGEQTWGRLREQPPVRQAITTLGTYGERLDGRVDDLVESTAAAAQEAAAAAQEAAAVAQAAAARALEAVERQTRATGRRLSGRAADAVLDATAATVDAVEDAGTTTAGVLEDVGTDVDTDGVTTTGTAGEGADGPGTGTAPAPRKRRSPRRMPPAAT